MNQLFLSLKLLAETLRGLLLRSSTVSSISLETNTLISVPVQPRIEVSEKPSVHGLMQALNMVLARIKGDEHKVASLEDSATSV
jgi:hypothetical protein